MAHQPHYFFHPEAKMFSVTTKGHAGGPDVERTLTREEMLADPTLDHLVDDTGSKNELRFNTHEDALSFLDSYNPLEARQKVAVNSTGEAVTSVTLHSRICSHCSAGYGQQADKKPTLRCGKCRNVWYCDAVCQRADWKKHKKICEKFKQDRAESK